MRIGVLTSGGDCPGLDAAIRAVTRRLIGAYDFEVLGIRNGFRGLVRGEIEPLSLHSVSGILPKGGTILGTSRVKMAELAEKKDNIGKNLQLHEIDALIVIGDNDTIAAANMLTKFGIDLVCIPATIDNDIPGTDVTFGYDTAVAIAAEAIDRVHTTADSHHRIMVLELMGGKTGWIATMAGLAGGADCILIPEVDFSIEQIAELLKKRHSRKKFSIVVVAEGIGDRLQQTAEQNQPQQRVADIIGRDLETRTGMETRVIILGHIQRGGTPSASDRILATRFGVRAADMVANRQFGYMTALQGASIEAVLLSDIAGKTKFVDRDLYDIASVFFG